MADKITTLEGEKLDVLEHTDVTFEQAVNEFQKAIGFAATRVVMKPELLMVLTQELLHWMYLRPGTHGTPYEILKQLFDQQVAEQFASSDAAPGKTND